MISENAKSLFLYVSKPHRGEGGKTPLQRIYSNRGIWKKIMQSERFFETKDSQTTDQ